MSVITTEIPSNIEELKYLTNNQKWYLKFCELFGVKIFKKFWHIKGYFVNNKLDKNNEHHLNYVIQEANSYTDQHKSGIFAELFSLYTPTISYGIYDLITNKNKNMLLFGIVVTSSCLIYHGYALLVHQYNRIKAKARLQYLEENPDKNTKIVYSNFIRETDNKINKIDYNKDDDLLIISNVGYKNYEYYDMYIKNTNIYTEIYFSNLDKIKKFREYIYKENLYLNKETLFNLYNLNKFKNLYENFIKIDNQ